MKKIMKINNENMKIIMKEIIMKWNKWKKMK